MFHRATSCCCMWLALWVWLTRSVGCEAVAHHPATAPPHCGCTGGLAAACGTCRKVGPDLGPYMLYKPPLGEASSPFGRRACGATNSCRCFTGDTQAQVVMTSLSSTAPCMGPAW
jgi:hypothetical protein